MSESVDRVLLHLGGGRRRVIDPFEVYYLEVLEEATRVLPVSRGLLGRLWKAYGAE